MKILKFRHYESSLFKRDKDLLTKILDTDFPTEIRNILKKDYIYVFHFKDGSIEEYNPDSEKSDYWEDVESYIDSCNIDVDIFKADFDLSRTLPDLDKFIKDNCYDIEKITYYEI